MRECKSTGKPASFEESDYALTACEAFLQGEKLCIRWRGPRRVL